MSSVAHDGGRLAKLGLAAALASRVLGRLVGIVLVVLLARASPNTVAVYGYLLGTATLVATFTDLGVAAVAGREVAAGRLPADGRCTRRCGPRLRQWLQRAWPPWRSRCSPGPMPCQAPRSLSPLPSS